MHAKRATRVAELLKREISSMLLHEIKDPQISLVTITNVKMSDDLKSSKIYFTVLGDESRREDTLKGLDRAKNFIKSEIGKRLNLRYVPEIKFYYDTITDQIENLENLFSKIKEGTPNQ